MRIRTVALAIAGLAFGCSLVGAADDPSAAARASLERVQALRKDRPSDGLLVFYEAVSRVAVGERDAAYDLLRSLQGRKLGLIPVRDTGFDAIWDDPAFEQIRKDLAAEEQQTPAAPV